MNVPMFQGRVDGGEGLRGRIRHVLSARHFMRVDELRMRLGEPEELVRAELESLMLRGEVERIRPIGYTQNDLDVYVVPKADGHVWDV